MTLPLSPTATTPPPPAFGTTITQPTPPSRTPPVRPLPPTPTSAAVGPILLRDGTTTLPPPNDQPVH